MTESQPPGSTGARADQLLSVHDVSHVFTAAGGRSAEYAALEGVSLHVRPREFVSIIGPSGCGKSTLLTLVAGLTQPTHGSIEVFGQRVTGVRRDVGFVFQRDALLPWKTVSQNVQLALKFRSVPRQEAQERARDWLARFGLLQTAERYPHQLSGGQRKRVSIAATLIYEPALLLMDEPFVALDAQTRDVIENDVLRVWQQTDSQSILFVTHDLEEAIALSDRVIVMSAGPGSKVIADYAIELPRPRDLFEIRTSLHFREIYSSLWEHLRVEVQQARTGEQ